MFSQTELENYKLQVELLQEKLKRSEDQRQQLEERYETVTKRRIEQEKSMKNEFRRKYHHLLEEQKHRNERNKDLIKLLDRVDQQAAVLAARTERLRMLKIQYELYLTRMLQFQCMRSIENNIHDQPVQMSTKQQFANLRPQGYSEIYAPTDNSFKLSATEEAWTPLSPSDSSTKNLPSYPSAPAYYRFPGSSHMQPEQLLPSYDLQRHLNFKTAYGPAPTLASNMPMKSLGDQKNKIDLSRFDTCSSAVKSPIRDDRIQTGEGTRLAPDAPHQNKSQETYSDRPSLSRMNSVDEKGFESDRLRYMIPDKQRFQRNGSRDTDDYDIDDDDSIDNEEKVHQKQSEPVISNAMADEVSSEQKEEGQKIQTPSSERKISLSELPLETVLKDISKLSFDRLKRQTKFNFGEEKPSPKENTHSGIQFKKKEKLSIENIENAIYGERIDPLARKMNEQLLQPDVIEKYDQQRPFNEYVEKEEPQINVAPNDDHPNDVLFNTREIPDSILEPEVDEQPILSVLPLKPEENASNVEETNNDNGNLSSLQKLENVESSDQCKEDIEPISNKEDMEKTVVDTEIIYKDYQQSPTQKNDNVQEPLFAEQIPDADPQMEQNLYDNTNGIEEQNHYNNAHYDGSNYGYVDQQGYYQDQEYEQQEYAQQGYDYSQEANYSAEEYNQPYQEDMNYNYAFNSNPNDQFMGETYQQSANVDNPPSGDIINENVSNADEDTSQMQNDTNFSRGEGGKSIITEQQGANDTETSQNLTQQKANDDSEIAENSLSESSKTDELPTSPQESAAHPIQNIVPTSILSSGDKQTDATNGGKKKKRVNFVDSETDDNSSQRVAPVAVIPHDESDFDFSSN